MQQETVQHLRHGKLGRPARAFFLLLYVVTGDNTRGVTSSTRRELKRRNAIEPIIGRMKNNGPMHRNYLKGGEGDATDVILCGAGQNLRLILRYLRIFWLKICPTFMCRPLLSSMCTA